MYKSILVQLCRAELQCAVLQEGEESDIKYLSPHFYLLGSLNCSHGKQKLGMTEESLAPHSTCSKSCQATSQVSTMVNANSKLHEGQQVKAKGKSKRLISRMMLSGDSLSKETSERVPKSDV